MRTKLRWMAVTAAALLVACSPGGPGADAEAERGAAPDLTPATTPPPVPRVDPNDTTVEHFDATSRTDVGAVEVDTIRREP